MDTLQSLLDTNFTNFHMPDIRGTDIVEILIIAFLVYHMLVWMRNTRIWSLMKVIVVIVIFIIIAALFNMNTILWIVQNVLSIAVIAVVVVLQPELRRALEQLGRKNFLSGIFPFDISGGEGRFSDRTIDEIARACVEMAKVRTGALIVIEQEHSLAEYEQTGIEVDAIVTSQLLINIFEHNTPLHDGAVIVRGNRITAATCYLPLSDNMNIGKELGTRHRAGVGVSEVTDSLTIIVSEETGKISVAYGGVLDRSLDSEKLKDRLRKIQNKTEEEHKHRPVFRGRAKAE